MIEQPLGNIAQYYCNNGYIIMNGSPQLIQAAWGIYAAVGPSLVQIIACRLVGGKPLPEPIMAYCQMDIWEQISVKRLAKYSDHHRRNAFENVICKMATISSRAQCLEYIFPAWYIPLPCMLNMHGNSISYVFIQICCITIQSRTWILCDTCSFNVKHIFHSIFVICQLSYCISFIYVIITMTS